MGTSSRTAPADLGNQPFLDTGGSIIVNFQLLSGSLTGGTDANDVYRFTATQAMSLLFDPQIRTNLIIRLARDTNGNLILDSGDTLLGTQEADSLSSIRGDITAGTYFIELAWGAATPASYTVGLFTEAPGKLGSSALSSLGNVPADAIAGFINDPQQPTGKSNLPGSFTDTGNLLSSGSLAGTFNLVDEYKFTISAPTTISSATLAVTGTPNRTAIFTLYSDTDNNGTPSGTEAIGQNTAQTGGGGTVQQNAIIQNVTLQPGEYTFRASIPFNLSSNINYTISIASQPTGGGGTGGGNPLSQLDTPITRFQNTSVLGTYLFAGAEESQSIRQNFPNFTEEGLAFQVGVQPGDSLIPLYRFQNTQRIGTYLFAGETEAANIRANFPGFTEEGLAFYVLDSSANLGTQIYRFQNTSVPGTYLFAGPTERDNILANFPNFVLEGEAFEVA